MSNDHSEDLKRIVDSVLDTNDLYTTRRCDRGLGERVSVQDLLTSLERSYSNLRVPNTDPPDVIVDIGKRKVGVEVTSLNCEAVRAENGKTIKESKKFGKSVDALHYTHWEQGEFIGKLQAIIKKKHEKLKEVFRASKIKGCDELWLLITCDEDFKEEWIKTAKTLTKYKFDEVYLLYYKASGNSSDGKHISIKL